jgi:hypothetical protein
VTDNTELTYIGLVFARFVIPRVVQVWRIPRARVALTMLHTRVSLLTPFRDGWRMGAGLIPTLPDMPDVAGPEEGRPQVADHPGLRW